MRRSSAHPTSFTSSAGLTLVELLVGLAVLAVLATAVVPSLADALERRRLATAAADAASLLQAARTAALVRGEPVRVTLLSGGAGQCLLLHAGASAGCRCDTDGNHPQPRCMDAAALVLAHAVPSSDRITLALGAAGLRHDPATGTTTPTATLRVSGRAGSVQHMVNLMGRVRSCASPAGLGGHAGC